MIRRLLPVILFALSAPHAAAMTLTAENCPFEADTLPDSHEMDCYRMEWIDEGIAFRSTAAVFKPTAEGGGATPAVYLPGGPGDVPVDDDAQPEAVLALFPGRTVIMFNPRGVENTTPRPVCTFDSAYWAKDLPFEHEARMTRACRATVDRQGVPLHLFAPRALAGDVDALVNALNIAEAGVFGVSYGTETALHLVADRPNWLRYAILDSVSLPGVVGLADQLIARDKFLRLIDALCFTNRQCPDAFRQRYDRLIAWTVKFDRHPLKFKVGPHGTRWSFDGGDMLDYLSGLSTYPDGAAYAVELIQVLESAPRDGADFIASEVTANTEFGIANYALLLETYSDGVTKADYDALQMRLAYPTDRGEYREYLDLYRLWNTKNRRERPFARDDMHPRPPGVPVLMLSGGVDMATPVTWALRLHKRFSGIEHYIFPSLGHATAFGKEGDVNDAETIQQMKCAPKIIGAFLSDAETPFPCDQFRAAR